MSNIDSFNLASVIKISIANTAH